ncbi:hypothetical protein [uncultured Paludibaculum sp.]|uniref:hypothetical protein n=1 Tax=uncultured Paludibaculum sp. TaxID=1765020 RepID=UPI002AAC06A0|nr:hypothetical protein [uncultured Paludibaculum sp.]
MKVTDPGGRWKKYTTDAFGNLVQVNEPNRTLGRGSSNEYRYSATANDRRITSRKDNVSRMCAQERKGRLPSRVRKPGLTTKQAAPL